MAVHSLKKGKPVRQQVSKAEWDRRVDLAAAYRLMDLYGMTEMSANHISTGSGRERAHQPLRPAVRPDARLLLHQARSGGNILSIPELVNKAGYVIQRHPPRASRRTGVIHAHHRRACRPWRGLADRVMPMRFRIAYHT
jgi:ribulose-5-phosphate 4-epimerase/fuculose-1-phosphate aldolase